ncbi:copper-binding protein [Aeromonas simiae]|nr:copper-binding protein [Aeromonas simiae]
MTRNLLWPLLAATLTLNTQAAEMDGMNHQAMNHQAMPAMDHAAMSEPASGEVRKIEGNKVTLKHGPLKALGMPGMTMTFEAADPAELTGLKVGDKVHFTPRSEGGKLVAVGISKS